MADVAPLARATPCGVKAVLLLSSLYSDVTALSGGKSGGSRCCFYNERVQHCPVFPVFTYLVPDHTDSLNLASSSLTSSLQRIRAHRIFPGNEGCDFERFLLSRMPGQTTFGRKHLYNKPESVRA
jgi:hypothetical protein